MNYKHWYPPDFDVYTHCDEFENEIQDSNQLEKIFSVLDFKHLVTVEKKRMIYKIDEFEISLDKVKKLGTFLEIEAIKNLGSVEETREKLFAFAQKLNIDILNKIDKRGYPKLLLNK